MRAVGGIPSVEATVFVSANSTPTAWTMTAARRDVALSIRLPQEPHPPQRAHGCRRQYHRPFGVVSKCALREKEKRPGCPERIENHRIGLNTSHKNSSNCSKVICVVCGNAFSKIAPSWISRRVLALRSFSRSRICAASNRCFACDSFFSFSVI